MKNFIYTWLLLCSFSLFSAQTAEDKKEVSQAVADILKGFQTKDAGLMNKYVDGNYGVAVLFKSGGSLGFVLNEEVDFGMPLGYIQKAWNIRNQFPIQLGNASGDYDAKNKKWVKEGLFVQLNSNAVNDYADRFLDQSSVKEQTIFKINSDPENVVFVTLAENSKEKAPVNGFRFVMTKIGAQWILTFIDVTEYNAE